MDITNTVNILKSLADEVRLSIVRQLVNQGCEASSSEIVASCAKVFSLSQPTMSHHFGRLVESGVLMERKKGTVKYYQINHDQLAAAGIDPFKL
ncbi:hypothetical protein B7Y94_00975 [Candidatus Saccharibacteria bacterium 32-49-12]|nr:MAG: hypothetical protein B7Y94_00975 [Candidatus Saccharibacteria bacterium 32-49-12]